MSEQRPDRFNVVRPVNGWPNHPTWAAGLWLTNEYALYQDVTQSLENSHASPEMYKNIVHLKALQELHRNTNLCFNWYDPFEPGSKACQKLILFAFDMVRWELVVKHWADSLPDLPTVDEPDEWPETYLKADGEWRNTPTKIVADMLGTTSDLRSRLEDVDPRKLSNEAQRELDDTMNPLAMLSAVFSRCMTRKAEIARDTVEDDLYVGEIPASLASDLLNWSMSFVDWGQIYKDCLGFEDVPEKPGVKREVHEEVVDLYKESAAAAWKNVDILLGENQEANADIASLEKKADDPYDLAEFMGPILGGHNDDAGDQMIPDEDETEDGDGNEPEA